MDNTTHIDTSSNAGAPIKYDPDTLTTEISQRIADDESIMAICSDPHMPDRDTLRRWMHKGREGDERYIKLYASIARARAEQPHSTYNRMIDIEHQVLSNDVNPNAARVVLDSMRWRASRMDPKQYGDHKQLEVSGGIDLTVSPVSKRLPGGHKPAKIAADNRKLIGDK